MTVAEASTPAAALFPRILWGIALGILTGLFLGDVVHPLALVATGFVRLLQINVLPYLLGSLMSSIGSRGSSELRLIAKYGVGLLLLVWGITLVFVVLSPVALPPFSGAPIFGFVEASATVDWLDLYIPANLFHALANNLIPAVVLFGILAGIALGQLPHERKAVLLNTLDAFNDAMSGVSRMILRLTPFGLFAIAAVTAGQFRVQDALRLQVWLHFYAIGTLVLALWVLPALVARVTPVSHRAFLLSMRNAMVTAAAAGDALVVLPLIAASVKGLLVERGAPDEETDRAVGVAVPLLYNFPHAGKILSLAFLPFAAWFSGGSLRPQDFALLASAGPLSLFGNINAAMPFLLDLLRQPADLFELFTVSSVVNSRFGAMVAATHNGALSVMVAAAMLGRFKITVGGFVRFGIATAGVLLAFLLGTRALFGWVLPLAPAGLETLSHFRLRPPLADVVAAGTAADGEKPQRGGRLQEIRARGLIRIGYFADAMPWAFVNAGGELVGHDIEAAHRLARQMNLRLEFVEVHRTTPAADLTAGRIDILMSGVTATPARAEYMELSHPYSREHVGFLVRDFDRRRFESLATLDGGEGMVIAVPPLEGVLEGLLQVMPRATTRVYEQVDEMIKDDTVTAVLTSLERAYYWSRVHPELAAVRPAEVRTGTITVYAMPLGELELRNVIDLWIETRKASGEADDAYEYWIRGQALTPHAPRWSLLRSVLGHR